MNRFQSWYRMQPAAIRALLTINVVFYVLWVVVLSRIGVAALFVEDHLALQPAFPGLLFEPWQLVTYNFLHLGVDFWGLLHILFNMLWLVWIGREFEEMHGPHRLMAIYLITGIGGGLLTVVIYGLFPPPYTVYVHGASASVLGVITAVAVMYPYKSIALLFIGTVRLIYVVIAFLVLDLFFLGRGGTAVWAHLGGAFFGFLFVKAEAQGLDLSSWARIFFGGGFGGRRSGSRSGSRGRGAPSSSDRTLARLESWLSSRGSEKSERKKPRPADNVHPLRSSQPEEPPATDNDVDRILDKISEKGYEALTEEEKRILYEASRR